MIIRNIGPPRIYLPSKRRIGDERPDVMLIQGFATGGRAMEWIARDLSAQGLECTVPRARGLLGYLQTKRVAKAAAGVAKLLRDRPGPRRTWLIGHSIGGIIARHVVQMQDHGDAVAGVITIGSPHRGTAMAILGTALGLWIVSRSALDVTPRARVLRQLNGLPWPDDVPLVSVFSRTDLLCPHRSSVVPIAGPSIRMVEVPGLGHTELLWNRSSRDIVVSAVLDGRPSHAKET